eukprot:TRINITY_DN98037_c0_g1_i1.p1 TRINITY_DN98037_c0_g1~~TRINITY_DN98037_c0_g1_i1.p1  ORF type:complete len:200 (+),score=21.22 TRINITY_DN98037_c0_g1_i1:62-661(+)
MGCGASKAAVVALQGEFQEVVPSNGCTLPELPVSDARNPGSQEEKNDDSESLAEPKVTVQGVYEGSTQVVAERTALLDYHPFERQPNQTEHADGHPIAPLAPIHDRHLMRLQKFTMKCISSPDAFVRLITYRRAMMDKEQLRMAQPYRRNQKRISSLPLLPGPCLSSVKHGDLRGGSHVLARSRSQPVYQIFYSNSLFY